MLGGVALASVIYPASSADNAAASPEDYMLAASGVSGAPRIALAPASAPVNATILGAVSAIVPTTPERQLLEALDTFRDGNVELALSTVKTLVRDKPNFRLAHLVHGDMLASLAGVPLSLSAESDIPRNVVDGFIAEARQRVKRADFHPGNSVPSALMRLSPEQEYGIAVDLSRSRLYLFANTDGQPRLVGDYYVSGGKNGAGKEVKGDKKTPIGVYFVTSRLPGEDLPDRYGPMAFPVDYPNDWDRRSGRTGDGIWLHGVATSTYSRPPLDSDGCVAMSNDDLSSIADLLEAGVTPVVISNDLHWVSPTDVRKRRDSLEAAIEQWRSDWQSGNTERYLSHYAADFQGRGMNRAAWIDYKRQVNANKQFIRISMNEVSMFEYPDVDDMAVVTFEQRYESDRFASDSRKRQYWQLQRGRWRIVSESAI